MKFFIKPCFVYQIYRNLSIRILKLLKSLISGLFTVKFARAIHLVKIGHPSRELPEDYYGRKILLEVFYLLS